MHPTPVILSLDFINELLSRFLEKSPSGLVKTTKLVLPLVVTFPQIAQFAEGEEISSKKTGKQSQEWVGIYITLKII